VDYKGLASRAWNTVAVKPWNSLQEHTMAAWNWAVRNYDKATGSLKLKYARPAVLPSEEFVTEGGEVFAGEDMTP
jgi:hypothetical protein